MTLCLQLRHDFLFDSVGDSVCGRHLVAVRGRGQLQAVHGRHGAAVHARRAAPYGAPGGHAAAPREGAPREGQDGAGLDQPAEAQPEEEGPRRRLPPHTQTGEDDQEEAERARGWYSVCRNVHIKEPLLLIRK